MLVAAALATAVVPADAKKPCRRLCKPLVRLCVNECVSQVHRRGPCAFGCKRTIYAACRLTPDPSVCAVDQ
jgi:hypothetical protein